MSTNKTRLTAAVVLWIALQSLAHATPVTWYLSGVLFADGGSANGSFVYDADTNVYSAVNITTTSGSSFAGAHYIAPLAAGSSASFLEALTAASGDLTNTPMLQLWYNSGLTNAGGTVTFLIANTGEFSCFDAGCTSASNLRHASAGSVTTTLPAVTAVSTPALSQWMLALLACLLLAAGAVTVRGRR